MTDAPIVVRPGQGHVVGNVEFLARTVVTPRFSLSIIEIVAGRELGVTPTCASAGDLRRASAPVCAVGQDHGRSIPFHHPLSIPSKLAETSRAR
jgi:hypothetical protein